MSADVTSAAAATISAVAATIAATLTGVNIHLTGRRETVKWRRDVLANTFVDALTASYNHWHFMLGLLNTPRNAETEQSRQKLLERARSEDEVMMGCQSRFRVLSADEALDAAREIHNLIHKYHKYFGDVVEAGGRLDQCELKQAQLEFEAARDLFVDCAKSALKLGSVFDRFRSRLTSIMEALRFR